MHFVTTKLPRQPPREPVAPPKPNTPNPQPHPPKVAELERRAAASAAAGRSVADVDADLGEVEARRSHREVDREQLLRKQVGWGRGAVCLLMVVLRGGEGPGEGAQRRLMGIGRACDSALATHPSCTPAFFPQPHHPKP